MSRALFIVAILAVVAVVATVLLWPETAAPPAPLRPAMNPPRAEVDADGGRLLRPHPDRVGLHHRPPQ